jgi:hypothetical protein
MAAMALAASLALVACSTEAAAPADEPPAGLEETAVAGIYQITLTESAARRLDIQTSVVVAADAEMVVPSAAVIIDPEGNYWVYTSPENLVFLRQELRGAREENFETFYGEGPAVGTAVVTTGVPELYGAESGIGK